MMNNLLGCKGFDAAVVIVVFVFRITCVRQIRFIRIFFPGTRSGIILSILDCTNSSNQSTTKTTTPVNVRAAIHHYYTMVLMLVL